MSIECFSYLNKFFWIWNLILRSIIVQIEFFLTDAAAIQFLNWDKQKREREIEIERVNNRDLNYVLNKVLHAHPPAMLHSLLFFVFFIGLFFLVKYWFCLFRTKCGQWTLCGSMAPLHSLLFIINIVVAKRILCVWSIVRSKQSDTK